MKVTDPVCKMEVESETAQYKSEYQGQTYHFCSPGCKGSFDREPEIYMGGNTHQEPGGHSH